MVKFAHIVVIPMTGVGVGRGFKNDAWFKDRIDIFKKYTLNSLLKQSNRAFLLWLTFRPQERNHPYVRELAQYLHENRVATIMTFEGLMWWDDKFSKGLKNAIMNIARVGRQCWRDKDFKPLIPATLEIIFAPKNKTLLNRLERALYELRKAQELQDANYIFVTRIDSDDMFHREEIAEIQRVTPFEGALVHKNGYIYNSNTNEMAEWNPKTNPPFHTIIFLGSKFFNPVEHLRFYNGFRSHEDVTKCFKTKQLEDGRYCVLIHQKHISTIWDHPFKGKPVDPKLLEEFI